MTELSFLIDLLLNHKLPKPVKELISNRIKEVETNLNMPKTASVHFQRNMQAPSTLAAMAKHGDLAPPAMPAIPEQTIPVEHIAQTPETAAALASRNLAISQAITGKVEKGRTSPRKW